MYSHLFIAFLFFVLTPGILLTLPSGSSKITVAAVHAIVFVIILEFTLGYFIEMDEGTDEGFRMIGMRNTPNVVGGRFQNANNRVRTYRR